MTETSTGIGIGTATHSMSLDIQGQFNGDGLRINGTPYCGGGACDNAGITITNNGSGGTSWSFDSTGNSSGFGQGNMVFAEGGLQGGSPRLVLQKGGNVGVGSTTPRATLDVNGSVISNAALSNASSTIDFSKGNLQYTTASCGAFVLHNMKDGGTYSFMVQGTTAATCSFTAYSDAGSTALTVRMPPDHGATIAGRMTLYSFMVFGNYVIPAWTPGY
jgi:hypothetical protein